jgi:DNA-binding GntR family transcriptional regulator
MKVEPARLPAYRLARSSLKEQTARLLRDLIVAGRIPPGAKITERDVASWLDTSRMPARDALMALEQQGLIVSRPSGRYVIELSAADVRHLYQVRLALERLALELAIPALVQEQLASQEIALEAMRRAVADGDVSAYVRSDLDMHQQIWRAAGNPYLLEMLDSLIGPIFMLVARQTRVRENWEETLELHADLLQALYARDALAAQRNLTVHLQRSLDLALSAFGGQAPAGGGGDGCP